MTQVTDALLTIATEQCENLSSALVVSFDAPTMVATFQVVC